MADESTYSELVKLISRPVEHNYSLQGLNPLQAGGIADYFVAATSTVELAEAVKAAIDLRIPYLVVGNVSQTLFSDGGFPGLIIHNKTSSYGVALDKSQMVVDSGISITRAVTLAASQGLAGIAHFYGQPGTIGGAVYNNVSQNDTDFLSLVRYVTLILPPSRIDREATIVRYKGEWLANQQSEERTKLRHLRATKGLDPQPIVLTVLLQLTSVRPDEIRNRLEAAAKQVPKMPNGPHFGPVFFDPNEGRVEELLKALKVHKIRVGTVFFDKRFPNVIRSKTPTARSQDIRELIETVQEKAREAYGVDLVSRYEYSGVW